MQVLGLKLNPRFASGQNRSQGQPDPTPHPALLKQPPPSGSISKKDAMVLNGSSPLHSSGTASLHTDSQPVKHASQHTDSTSAQRAFQHTDDTTAQAAAEELSQTTGQASQSVEQEARESSEQEAAQDSPVASAELRGHSPEREGSRAVHNRFSPDAPAVELSSSLASDSVSSQPSTSAKHSMHSMSHESAVSQPSESADMPRQQLEEEDEGEPTDSHGDMSSGEAGKEAVSKQALEDGNCPADTRAVGPALPFQHRADAQNGVEAPLQECKTASESRLELPQGQNSSSTAPDVKIVIKYAKHAALICLC